jgi:creatinine amidohydrolase
MAMASDTPKHRLAEMTWPEVRQAAEIGRVVFQPVAAIEQHGPHLPVDSDNRIADAVADAAAAAQPAEFIVAPLIPYGFNDHNMEFPGTITIRPSTFLDYLYDVGHSFATMGFRRLIYINGHGSNRPVVELAARRVTNETPALAAMTLPSMLARMTEEGRRLRTSELGGVSHACEFETSMYLHLAPALVRKDLIADEFPQGLSPYVIHDPAREGTLVFMSWYSQRTRSGVDGAPTHATREKGAAWFRLAVEGLVAVARSFRDMDLPERVDLRPPGAWQEGLRS